MVRQRGLEHVQIEELNGEVLHHCLMPSELNCFAIDVASINLDFQVMTPGLMSQTKRNIPSAAGDIENPHRIRFPIPGEPFQHRPENGMAPADCIDPFQSPQRLCSA